MIDTKELRRLAQAATPGPWIAAGPSSGESLPKYLNEVVVDREGDEDDGYSICNPPIGLDEECSDDMAFIAAANPATISELLDRLEAAEKEVESWKGLAQQFGNEADALRAKIEQMERQRPVRLVFRSDELDEQIRRATDPAWAEKIDVPEGMVALYALPGAKGE